MEVESKRITKFVWLCVVCTFVTDASCINFVLANHVFAQLAKQFAQCIRAKFANSPRRELHTPLTLIDQPGILHHLGQLRQLVKRFGCVIAQKIPHFVHVGLGQSSWITRVFHEVFELIQVGQILHGLHGLLEAHWLLTRKVVLVVPPGLGKHSLQVLRQLIHLPAQVHVFKQLLRELL